MSDQPATIQPRDPYATEPIPKSWPGRAWFMLRIAYFRFGFAGSPLMAAAIAFYSLMCFMPLGMFMVWSLGKAFGHKGDVLARLNGVLSQSISPAAADSLTHQLAESFSLSDPAVTGVLGALGLVWAGHRLFEILEISLTRVWHGRPVRGILMRKVFAFAMLIAACACLGAYMFAIATVATVRVKLTALDPNLGGAMIAVWYPLTRAVAAATAFVAFLLIYSFLPRDRVPLRVALLGALVATALWHAATALFSHYIGQSSSYQSLYGSMTSVVLFGLWAYTAGIILLVSAALSSAYFAVFSHTEEPDVPPEPAPAG
jgi:membrane protein